MDIELSIALLEQLGGQPEAFLTAVGYVLASPKLTLTQAAKAMLEPARQSRWTVNWMTMTEAEKATLLLLFDQKPPTGREAIAWAREFTTNPKLSATTIARALESLIVQGLVEKDLLGGRGKYQIVDPVMRTWLKHNRVALKNLILHLEQSWLYHLIRPRRQKYANGHRCNAEVINRFWYFA
ncbi:MAG: hypothetical protein HC782_05905 [Gammaproteobacteria bacterium]|nr:hypothetical protein [Gammaproteobacteria bacterium]